MVEYVEACCIAEYGCTHAINLPLYESAKCKCIPCDRRVCANCSLKRYDKTLKRTVRVCLECAEEDPERFGFKNVADVRRYWMKRSTKPTELVIEAEV